MLITTHVSFKEYLKLLFVLTYKKPMMRFLVLIAIMTLIWITIFYLHISHLPKPSFYQYIIIIQPVAIYSTIRKNYYSSSYLNETLKIEFTKKQIRITSDSFYIELKWEKTHKVQELKNCFLIYENNLSAIIIPKKCLNHKDEEFKEFFKALPQKSVHLKVKLNNN